VEIHVTHRNWTISYILHHILPEEVHPPPTAYEQVGHVAHLNLKEHHVPYAHVIGDVLVECIPNIETVINKVGQVSGKHRTFEMDVLAGEPDFDVQVSENGVRLGFDLEKVYWCSKLSGEREYLLKHVFREGQIICDPFCGVGAACILAATKRNCRIWANDWNPHAVEACRKNAKRNHVASRFEKLDCADAYDFLTDIGLDGKLPDHVLMNYPLEATKFLSTLRWWPSTSDVIPTVHVYTFARQQDNNNNNNNHQQQGNRSFLDVAIDDVADHLFPAFGAVEETMMRKDELDELGCNVQARFIRDVAPGKVVVCVSFQVTNQLLRNMQGDFD